RRRNRKRYVPSRIPSCSCTPQNTLDFKTAILSTPQFEPCGGTGQGPAKNPESALKAQLASFSVAEPEFLPPCQASKGPPCAWEPLLDRAPPQSAWRSNQRLLRSISA